MANELVLMRVSTTSSLLKTIHHRKYHWMGIFFYFDSLICLSSFHLFQKSIFPGLPEVLESSGFFSFQGLGTSGKCLERNKVLASRNR